MPAVRLSRRRRSSLAITALKSAKPGYYGIQTPSPRPVTFAPNVTPGTYVEPEFIPSESSSPSPESPESKLFPPMEAPAPAPSRRRVPPGKRRSMGYIPRPPNAFMLFRADFVRQKHVPGSIETNHGSLSKIIGNCWRSLPLEEKRVWEIKAKHAKADHKARYPEYRFRPVHNKNKDKKAPKPAVTVDEEERCEAVAQLLLEGKKGDELAAAVRDLDSGRNNNTLMVPTPTYAQHRRSSSVPLPNDWNPIALPALPYYGRQSSSGSFSLQSRMILGQRRASSARPAVQRAWTMPSAMMMGPPILQRDDSPLPEVDTSLFEQSFLNAGSGFSFNQFNFDTFSSFNDVMPSLPPHAHAHAHDQQQQLAMNNVSPLEHVHHHSQASSQYSTSSELDPLASWLPLDQTHSDPSSAYSGSPAPSDHSSLPVHHIHQQGQPQPQVHAPQPQHAGVAAYEVWKDITSFPTEEQFIEMGMTEYHMQQPQQPLQAPCEQQMHQQPQYGMGMFDEQAYNAQLGFVDMNDMTQAY